MNKYKVKVLESADKEVWNLFVNHSPWGDILQLWEWGELKRLEGWRPMRVAVIDEGKIRLAAQILLKPVPLLGNYAYIPHGPVVHSTENLVDVFKSFIDYLTHYSKTYDFVSLEMDPKLGQFLADDKHPNLPKNLEFYTNKEYYQALEEAGIFITGRNTQPVYKLMYDLSEDNDQILAHCNKSTRYNINYAKKQGVEIQEHFPDDPDIKLHLDKFYLLLKETQVRAKGYPMHDKSYFYKLFELFKGTKHVVLTEAVVEGDTVAINISQRTKGWSSSFYAGSNRLHPKSKAAYLLRWYSIQSAKEYGAKTYDFWGIIPNSKEHQGYSSHKLGYGGYRLDTYGLLAAPLNPLKYSLWTNVIWLRTKGLSETRKWIWGFKKQFLPNLKDNLQNRFSNWSKDPKLSSPETSTTFQSNQNLDLGESQSSLNGSTKNETKSHVLETSLSATESLEISKHSPLKLPKTSNYLSSDSQNLTLTNSQIDSDSQESKEDKLIEAEITAKTDSKQADQMTNGDQQKLAKETNLTHSPKLTNSLKRLRKSRKSKSKVIKNFKKRNKTRSKIS